MRGRKKKQEPKEPKEKHYAKGRGIKEIKYSFLGDDSLTRETCIRLSREDESIFNSLKKDFTVRYVCNKKMSKAIIIRLMLRYVMTNKEGFLNFVDDNLTRMIYDTYLSGGEIIRKRWFEKREKKSKI